MDKATPSPASVDSVMAKAMMLVGALGDSCEAATSLPFLEAVTALRADVERLAAQAAPTEEMSPEFTDTARAALLWVLWHHQGGSSKVGQPIRFALGMDPNQPLSDYQVREAKRWEALDAQPSQAPVVQAVQATSEPQTWHDLKADPDAWDAVAAGIKTHEIRLDDRDFAVGDGLRLRKTRYTGHEMRTLGKPLEYIDQPIERIVSHIQRGYGLDPGWCILSFADRASSGATTAQAVRMLTREELNDVALSDQVGWEPGEYIEAVQRKFCAVNAGKRIPASGEIGSV